MNESQQDELLAALHDEAQSFTAEQLEHIIEKAFCDDSVPLSPKLVDAAVYRLIVLAGEQPTPENLQKGYTKVAYKYLRRSLGLPEK